MTDPETSAEPAVAGLERRFYAFALDRLVAWTAMGAVAYLALLLLVDRGHTAAGAAVIVAVVLLVGAALAVLLGLTGTSPGSALLGLRVVDESTGRPIGAGRALRRQLILAAATLPTFGLGLATLAWTAVADQQGRRQGWHDRVARSVVVDVRPTPAEAAPADPAPPHVVNLTALRLVPVGRSAPAHLASVPATPAPATPAPTGPPPSPPSSAPSGPPPGPPPSRPPTPPRQQLGHPLVAESPATPTSGQVTVARTTVRPGPAVRPARWRVGFDSGESFLVEGLALVGRRPEPRPGEPVRHLVPLRSEDLSLSKTHAQLQVAPDGALVVLDRGSTNGSILIRQEVARQLGAGRPATLLDGDRVRFGDREMTVVRESD